MAPAPAAPAQPPHIQFDVTVEPGTGKRVLSWKVTGADSFSMEPILVERSTGLAMVVPRSLPLEGSVQIPAGQNYTLTARGTGGVTSAIAGPVEPTRGTGPVKLAPPPEIVHFGPGHMSAPERRPVKIDLESERRGSHLPLSRLAMCPPNANG